jgi:hypothetical protein
MGRADLDSHANTSVVGDSTVILIFDFNHPVQVHGYDQSVAQRDNCKTVTGVLAYDHPTTGVTYYLILHQAILIPCMTVSLISPMQLRDSDLFVIDEPKCMALNLMDNHHCINIRENGDMEALNFPLLLQR